MTIVLNGTSGISTPALAASDIDLNGVNVVERGSNANGTFVRYADGTQICAAVATTVSIGTNSIVITVVSWPSAFSVVSDTELIVTCSAIPFNNVDTYGATAITALSTTSVSIAVRNGAAVAQQHRINAIGVGRWF